MAFDVVHVFFVVAFSVYFRSRVHGHLKHDIGQFPITTTSARHIEIDPTILISDESMKNGEIMRRDSYLYNLTLISSIAQVATNSPYYDDREEAVRIIEKKCQEYAQARYKTVKKGDPFLGQLLRVKKELDCPKTTGLITNGEHAASKEFPYMGLVGHGEDIDDIKWSCGGSLISENFVLSAAHCSRIITEAPSQWIALGLLKRSRARPDKLHENIFRIQEIFNHPQYNATHANYDIALYKLEKHVTFTPALRPICLQTSEKIATDTKSNAVISGWGQMMAGGDSSDHLLKTAVSLLDNKLCVNRYANDPFLKDGFDGETMLCAGDLHKGRDSCTGDSGGPIQIPTSEKCLPRQIGVTSFGSVACGDGSPAVYTKVSYYVDWIQRIVWPYNS